MTARCIRAKARAGKVDKRLAEQAARTFEGFEVELESKALARYLQGADGG